MAVLSIFSFHFFKKSDWLFYHMAEGHNTLWEGFRVPSLKKKREKNAANENSYNKVWRNPFILKVVYSTSAVSMRFF